MEEGYEEGKPKHVETVVKDELLHRLKFLIPESWKRKRRRRREKRRKRKRRREKEEEKKEKKGEEEETEEEEEVTCWCLLQEAVPVATRFTE